MKAQEMSLLKANIDLQKEYAKKVALNLYNYMLSFEKVIFSINSLILEDCLQPRQSTRIFDYSD